MAEHLKFKPIIAPYSSIADEEQTLYRALTTLKRLFVLTDHTKEIDLMFASRFLSRELPADVKKLEKYYLKWQEWESIMYALSNSVDRSAILNAIYPEVVLGQVASTLSPGTNIIRFGVPSETWNCDLYVVHYLNDDNSAKRIEEIGALLNYGAYFTQPDQVKDKDEETVTTRFHCQLLVGLNIPHPILTSFTLKP